MYWCVAFFARLLSLFRSCAVLEYLAAEVTELSGNAIREVPASDVDDDESEHEICESLSEDEGSGEGEDEVDSGSGEDCEESPDDDEGSEEGPDDDEGNEESPDDDDQGNEEGGEESPDVDEGSCSFAPIDSAALIKARHVHHACLADSELRTLLVRVMASSFAPALHKSSQ